jgi:germacradienol/geosmin synthase
MRQFEQLAAHDLPAMCAEYGLTEPVRAVLTRQAETLKDWMAGILEWHRRCARYTEEELRRHHGVTSTVLPYLPSVPAAGTVRSTIGTAAARIPAARRTPEATT